MAKAKRRTIHCDLFITDVDALTMRDVGGEGQQAELLIRTKAGTLSVRLISRRGGNLRLVDLRARDRKNRAKKFLVPVSFEQLGMRA